MALKVIKLGMDTKQVVARFEAERQALAMMDHPNIARVLDAGTTELGRPYFVMELVRGIKITEYCDQNNLTTKERLDLFIKVCQAIQHAHQKGIIHRDIKPSNILVTLHDGVPVPKVIDFGIAKATEGRLTDATVYTQLHQFVGTPAYMSPEQAEMSGLDIDTRSDIYSLGVLLYELLAGSTPFDANELAASGLDAMRKTIREKEPVRPSTRLATLKGDELTTTAKRRSTETAKLLHQLKGDLDWIVMKCLEKDRTRRYETANGLAYDLKRHLNNEPVLARPPSAAYKFQKAVRRNKLFYGAGLAVMLALAVGLGSATLMYLRERAALSGEQQQRQEAQASERKALAAEAGETRLREQAQVQELAARRLAYASEMNAARLALDGDKLGRALDLLNRQKPQPGQKDLRDWEWRHLWQQTRSGAMFTLCQESNGVMTLAASPDGDLLAVGDFLGRLSVRDLRTRQELICLTSNQDYWGFRAAFSPVEPLLAFATMKFESVGKPESVLRLWNSSTRQMTAEARITGACMGLAFSADSRTLLTSTSSGTEGQMTLWRVSDGTEITNYNVGQPVLGPQANPFTATPDLGLAAYSSPGGAIHVMDLRNGREIWQAQGSKLRITALAFSPDQKLLASAAGYEEKEILLWDAATGQQTGRLEGHGSFVTSLLFWPDGKRLASSSTDETIRIWDVARRKCLEVLRGSRKDVFRLALLADQKTLVSGGADGVVSVWDTATVRTKEPQLTLSEKVADFRFAPDSQSIVTLDQGGQVTQWSGAEFGHGEPLFNVGGNLTRGAGISWEDVFSRDGQLLAVGSTNGLLQVWNLPRRAVSCLLTNDISGDFSPQAFLDGGRKLLTSGVNSIDEWDLRAGLKIQSWPVGSALGCVSPDEHFCLAVGAENNRFMVLDLAGRQNTQLGLKCGGTGRAAFSPDGTRLVVADLYGGVHVFETGRWQEVATLGSEIFAGYALGFSPDGKRLVMAGIGRHAVQLWDTERWQDVYTLQGKGASYITTAVSADGNEVAALDATGLLQLWHAPSWREIAAAEANDPPSRGDGEQGKAEFTPSPKN